MKYMGSKRTMLSNGLGELLKSKFASAKRFADLFAGSSAVAWFAAENSDCQVLAGDLQLFAIVLANAVITRDRPLDAEFIWSTWFRDAEAKTRSNAIQKKAEKFQTLEWEHARRRCTTEARAFCSSTNRLITQAYGGHYFSPLQALQLDALRESLPSAEPKRSVALASLIRAASECAAAPGHTAQPFQPTAGAAPFLFEAWRRDVFSRVKSALEMLCPKHAKVAGKSFHSSAEVLAQKLGKKDLAFVDPPYSGVHYSRFYHVLETIARGRCDEVSGVGRYPSPAERPKSDFSIVSKSEDALDGLLSTLASRGVPTILTFPKESTSNGLSGRTVQRTAEKYFAVKATTVNGRFSTLGGNLKNRKARVPAYEIILDLRP